MISTLIERLGEATGPDREIDCRLSHQFERKGIWYGTGDDSGWAPAATVDGWDDRKWSSMNDEYVSPLVRTYTGSIDAALGLVERVLPGEGIVLETHGRNVAGIGQSGQYPSTGATPAIAICLAALRALKHQEPTND